MYLAKTPKFIQNLFPSFVWRIPTDDPVIYLTFDDGPIQEVTPWVLNELEKYNANGSFFCVGENVQNNLRIFNRILKKGHSIGSHTNNHLSGWATQNINYFQNVRKAATMVKSSLFRPPYGRIRPSQINFLLRHYHVIMWDVLSADFDHSISAEECLENVISHTRNGSIIVFHDSIKTFDKIRYVLPRVLEYFSEQGFRFEAITEELLMQKNVRISA